MEDYWRISSYVWSNNFALDCDAPPHEWRWDPDLYKDIKKGDIVWCDGGSVGLFHDLALPFITEPFFLIINKADESFPTYWEDKFDVDEFINDHRIIHIFAQNSSLANTNPKVSCIPIGLDFHTLADESRKLRREFIPPIEQEASLVHILSSLQPTSERKTRIFVDFQHHDTMQVSYNKLGLICGENRKTIFKKILKCGLVDYLPFRINRIELWKIKGKYAFSVSPHGNGWDCHRTWEDLVLGCIVIVKSSPLDILYEGLPVVIVKDWSEITKKNLERWQKQYENAFSNPNYRERLTHRYWMNQIRAKQQAYFEKCK